MAPCKSVCVAILVSEWIASASAAFCQSTLYTDKFVCEDGTAVNANGCCASTSRCPTSCMQSGWGSSGGVTTCTCTNCNYGVKLALTEQARYLKATNYFRCRHGQNALTWDAAVAANALTWATTCPSQGSNPAHTRPDSTTAYALTPSSGENVAAGQKSPEKAVEAWYSEITTPGYTPGTASQPPSGTGHYTAMIWAATKKLGCAQKPCASGTPKPVHVCHYADSAPNFGADAAYFANMPQTNTPSATEASCCTSVYGSGGGSTTAGSTGGNSSTAAATVRVAVASFAMRRVDAALAMLALPLLAMMV